MLCDKMALLVHYVNVITKVLMQNMQHNGSIDREQFTQCDIKLVVLDMLNISSRKFLPNNTAL